MGNLGLDKAMTTLRRNALLRRLDDGEIGVIANGLNSSDLCDFVGQFGFALMPNLRRRRVVIHLSVRGGLLGIAGSMGCPIILNV
jgi:hypothetical protein